MTKDRYSLEIMPDTLKMPLLEIFTIAGEATKIQESYKRYNLRFSKEKGEDGELKTKCSMALVEDWPAVTQDLMFRCTIKCVWVKGANDSR
jgi:hypothetical protein